SNDITVYVPSMGPWRAVTQGEQYQTLLPTMEDNMDARGDGLNCPLSYHRNDDKQTSPCRPW
ncbi:hypothetical protein ACLOJK_040452, partial [Asimina triloba]